MVTIALVSSIEDWNPAHRGPRLEDVIIAQHDSRDNFKEDWYSVVKSVTNSPVWYRREISTKDIYKKLTKMGWIITSLGRVDVLFNR